MLNAAAGRREQSVMVQRRQMDTIPRSQSCDSSGDCGYFGILVMKDLKMDLVSGKMGWKGRDVPSASGSLVAQRANGMSVIVSQIQGFVLQCCSARNVSDHLSSL